MKVKCLAKVFFMLCLFCAAVSLSAQSTAQEVEAILAISELTYAQAARFILRASEKLVTSNTEEAFWFAAKRYWLPKNVSPDDPARFDGISLLLLHSFDIEGGFMYSVTKSPHYAFRELMYRNIIQGRADRYVKVSGEDLVFITGRVLAESERETELAVKFAEERQTMGSAGHLQPESFDFGLIVTQDTAFYHDFNYRDTEFDYSATAVPRISFLLGDKGLFLTSMGITVEYDGEFSKLIELLRTEFSIRFGVFGLRVGRFNYSDPMYFVANGLFDGFQFTTTNSSAGQFGLGLWYTGALYKKNANILMNQNDWDIYNAPLVKGEFFKGYFAPRRMMVSMDWEHPSIGELLQLKTAITGQIDVSNQNEKYHSEYLTLSAEFPVKNFFVAAGGSVGAAQVTGNNSAFNLAVAGELGFYFTLPFKFDSQLSFKTRYASGNTGGLFSVFIPLTTIYQGEIFKTGISGHTVFDVTYYTRFVRTLGASLTASYFVRNDLVTPHRYIITGSDMGKKLLGAEFFSQLVWGPFSDMQYKLGIGTFVPAFGNNWPKTKSIWKFDLTTVFALY